ncbi:GcrA family cell cycle regulator [Devosia sp. ZB163]|uniref:GcrA family cell cycle regulator n=1 Tax=Devosia sp. ZB163 TaxID=3025938 RepID=UPI00235E2034|nr:GcrA family cell cycle regulator [Devosia sp. ZB163]MDC9825658.1 GcrA family cell cycle regulator [Devosia sp. ZB163]
MTGLDWSESRTQQLRELWAAGLSASEIAAAIGMTRNAVIGKASRLELARRRPASNPYGKGTGKVRRQRKGEVVGKRGNAGKYRGVVTKARNAREMAVSVRLARAKMKGATTLDEALKKVPQDTRVVSSSAWEALPGTMPIPLIMTSDATCRWPIGDPMLPGFGFCGCAVDDGSVYCATHRARGTTKFKASAEDKRKLERRDRSRRVFA